MADDIKPRIRVPATAKKGDVIEVKTLVTHPMETGQRKDSAGNTIPRKIIKAFAYKMNGKEVFAVTLEPAISANLYLSFFLRIDEPAALEFAWTDDDGSIYKAEAKVAIG